jgi:hypothetical protein
VGDGEGGAVCAAADAQPLVLGGKVGVLAARGGLGSEDLLERRRTRHARGCCAALTPDPEDAATVMRMTVVEIPDHPFDPPVPEDSDDT